MDGFPPACTTPFTSSIVFSHCTTHSVLNELLCYEAMILCLLVRCLISSISYTRTFTDQSSLCIPVTAITALSLSPYCMRSTWRNTWRPRSVLTVLRTLFKAAHLLPPPQFSQFIFQGPDSPSFRPIVVGGIDLLGGSGKIK